ncbi:unnamed protein product [Anisakis simplex]|uniref:Uncharacterized protein n=1 Tax=Anisakis simplex TaxID=6269 RepID=A0A0M3JMP4_ANISI|nr:unnamed protein product [Anisakis simplex]
MDEKTIRSETGPLGELAKTYTVRVARSSYEEGQEEVEGTKVGAEGGLDPKKTIQKRTRSKGRKRRSNVNDETDDRSKT